jgi:hypothetical protein
MHGQQEWPVILVGTLVCAYTLVMLTVFSCWMCKRRRTQVVAASAEGAPMAVAGEPLLVEPPSDQSLFKVRTVNRGRSALLAGSTSPGAHLAVIEKQIRMAFIRKVYALLSTQLLFTVAIVVGFIKLAFPSWEATQVSQFGEGVLNNWWVIWAAFVPLLLIICCLHSVKNSYPFNYGALMLFTLIESVVVAIICTIYFSAGFGTQILIAASVTMGIFLVLTLFTLQSKVDWGFLGPGLSAALFIMIFWLWLTFWLVPYTSFAFQQMYSLFGAIIFVGFIIYDTNQILRVFGVDDWLIAAIELYLDVLNLFLFLLQLLSGGGRSSN